jgi:4-carboxymuconolactone decarboxylase
VAIAALAVSGRPDKLEQELSAALDDHPDILSDIREVVFQLVPYCGWATALNTVTVLQGVLEARGLSMPPRDRPPLEEHDRATLRALGTGTARTVHPLFDKVAARLEEFDPDLVAHLTESAYGYIYNRPGMDLVTRELVAVAILAVAGQERQLRYHMEGAVNVGAGKEMVEEVLEVVRTIRSL